MANTEGMSEETMASLLSLSPETKKSKFALGRKHQARIQQRLHEPIGRPAATVIRASRPIQNTNKNNYIAVNNTVQETEQQQYESTYDENEHNNHHHGATCVLGAVVERDIISSHADKNARNGSSTKISHFATFQQDKNQGFPSLHMPIGTFVKDVSATKQTAYARMQPQQTQTPDPTLDVSQQQQQYDSIQRDSQALLDQMTPDEIQDIVQELKATLSPEMIGFLQKRRQEKIKSSCFTTTTTTRQNDDILQPNMTTTLEIKDIDAQEKERIASLSSSVKTLDDLDAVYAQQVGIPAHVGQDQPEEDDWNMACSLLRSTSPRQTLWAARVVCQRLEQDVLSAETSFSIGQEHDSWPYPTTLPVSLRCLLDSPVSQSNGYLLYTFVLQSLYALLKLRAHPSHVIDVYDDGARQTSIGIFQECFMKDAIPCPPFQSCYPTVPLEPVASTQDGNAVAYSTSSSSTGAQQDGEAFAKDPMWTLLTRMRILPRLAQLLSMPQLPDEAIAAICGILSMLSVRSVGAASAIAQHPTLLSSLLQLTLLSPTNDNSSATGTDLFHRRVAVPAVIFLCTLARQSRIAAAAIPVDFILLQLLAMSAESEQEHVLQQWSLILWRSVLRYGLGLSSLSTLITLSIPQIASGQPLPHSLAAEYLSSFANVCYCVRVAKSKPADEWNRILSSNDQEILSSALTWLAATFRQTMYYVTKSDMSSLMESNMRLTAARLGFLQSYLAASSQQDSNGSNDNLEWREVVCSLVELSRSQDLETILSMIPAYGYGLCTRETGDDCVDVVPNRKEATACAFMDSLASLLYTLSVSDITIDAMASIMTAMKRMCINWMNRPATESGVTDAEREISLARRGWINAANFRVCRLALAALQPSRGTLATDDFSIMRSHALSLIGRLQRGEEAFAAMLFSNDVLFRTDNLSQSGASPLSSFLMQELCATPMARQQLDHSFKLHYGFGLTAKEWGPFEVGTLLSETDSPEAPSSRPFAELLLPMGPLWLWKILSGTRNQGDIETTVDQSVDDEIQVLAACLELLLQIEDEEYSLPNLYTKQVSDGAKLYHLMNIFLHPETVLRDDRISELVTELFDRYTAPLRNDNAESRAHLIESFWQACLNHSEVLRSNKMNESNRMDEKDKRLLFMLMGQICATEKEMRPLIDFVIDMVNAYLEFGAQYDSFTRCIRLFLSNGFPPRVRCEAIRSLRDVLHLLTIPEEKTDSFVEMLNMCLGGLVDEERAVQDSAEFLDSVVSVLKEEGSAEGGVSRLRDANGGFFFVFAIASLARHSWTNMVEGDAFEEATKQRLSLLPKEIHDILLGTISRLQSDGGSGNGEREDLVSSVLDVIGLYQ